MCLRQEFFVFGIARFKAGIISALKPTCLSKPRVTVERLTLESSLYRIPRARFNALLTGCEGFISGESAFYARIREPAHAVRPGFRTTLVLPSQNFKCPRAFC
jgi:hypothetical protein